MLILLGFFAKERFEFALGRLHRGSLRRITMLLLCHLIVVIVAAAINGLCGVQGLLELEAAVTLRYRLRTFGDFVVFIELLFQPL